MNLLIKILLKKMYSKVGLDSESIARKIQDALESNIVLAKNKLSRNS